MRVRVKEDVRTNGALLKLLMHKNKSFKIDVTKYRPIGKIDLLTCLSV